MKKKKTKRDIYAIYDQDHGEIRFYISYGRNNKRKLLTYNYVCYSLIQRITTHHEHAVLALRDLLSICKHRRYIVYAHKAIKHMYINANITPISI